MVSDDAKQQKSFCPSLHEETKIFMFLVTSPRKAGGGGGVARSATCEEGWGGSTREILSLTRCIQPGGILANICILIDNNIGCKLNV